jgi:hypothetical protein
MEEALSPVGFKRTHPALHRLRTVPTYSEGCTRGESATTATVEGCCGGSIGVGADPDLSHLYLAIRGREIRRRELRIPASCQRAAAYARQPRIITRRRHELNIMRTYPLCRYRTSSLYKGSVLGLVMASKVASVAITDNIEVSQLE